MHYLSLLLFILFVRYVRMSISLLTKIHGRNQDNSDNFEYEIAGTESRSEISSVV